MIATFDVKIHFPNKRFLTQFTSKFIENGQLARREYNEYIFEYFFLNMQIQ